MRAWFLLLAACSSSSPVTPNGPPAALVAVPAPDDVQVATVNGRPVFGSCVADQIKRFPALSKQAALDQCIELELLAQVAEGKGLATFPEVVDVTRTALVRRLVDQFAAKYPGPDSLKTQIDDIYKKVGSATRPEVRHAWHAIVLADKKASEPEHAAARQIAEQLYQTLKDETGMFRFQLEAAVAALKLPSGVKIEVQELATSKDDLRWAAEFRGALFGITEVGRVAPVVKTDYGYHVILLDDLRPETAVEREQVFQGLLRQLFVQYVNELMDRSTIAVDRDMLGATGEEAP